VVNQAEIEAIKRKIVKPSVQKNSDYRRRPDARLKSWRSGNILQKREERGRSTICTEKDGE
jgi:hypothetical protein